MQEYALLGFGILLVVAIVYFAIRNTIPVVPFLYANAIMQAESRRSVSEKQWPTLAESQSLSELTNCLRETDYAESIEQAKDIKEYHIAIEKSFAKTVEELKEITPDSIDPLFDAYLMFWESKMLKTFYRAFLTGQEIDEQLVFPIGRITPSMLSHLKESETLADMKVVMTGTPYEQVFQAEYDSLEEFEVALDNFVFKHFVKKVEKTKVYEGDLVIQLLNFKFDVQNLLVLLKLEARDIPEEQRSKYLIKNDTIIHHLSNDLIKAKSIKDFVNICSRTHFSLPLTQALEKYEEDGSLSHFERQLYTHFKKTVMKHEQLHFQGPYPLFTHLVKKELEMKNLMTISKGIDSKMPSTEIKELVI